MELRTDVLIALGVIGVSIWQYLRAWWFKLPPGPRGLPFIGNAFSIPQQYSWKYYTKLKAEYGDLVYISAMGQPILLLNSYEVASDLLVFRASIYSDRPRVVMVGEIMGLEKGVSLGHYMENWRVQRKLFHQYMNKVSVRKYWPTIEQDARAFVLRVLDNNEDFWKETRLMAVRLIIGITYGHRVDSFDDEHVVANIRVNNFAISAMAPGAFMVDLFPILLKVPDWFPGTGWKKLGAYWAKEQDDMVRRPYEKVKRDVIAGTVVPSFTRDLVSDATRKGLAAIEELQMWVSGSMYSTGAGTIVAALNRFILAMVLHPNVQQRAQEEIDRVIGSQRLPSLEDLENLPYIMAVMKELLRWNTQNPLALPHRLMEDDVYQGYHIPCGATILANVSAMCLDPEVYPDPHSFLPERFLPSEGKNIPLDPRLFVFGFGRRVCAGQFFAEHVLYMNMVSLLSTTNMVNAVDENGNEMPPVAEFTGGIFSTPKPFRCRFIPRSSDAVTMLHDDVKSHE